MTTCWKLAPQLSKCLNPVKLADIVLVDEIEKLIDQLYLRSWTRAEDTQSVQNTLNRAKKLYLLRQKEANSDNGLRNSKLIYYDRF